MQDKHFFGNLISQVLHLGSQYSHVVPVSVVNPTGQVSTQVLSYLFSFNGVLQVVHVSEVDKQLRQFELH